MINYAVIGIEGYGRLLIDRINRAIDSGVGCCIKAAADSRLGDLPERAAELRGRGIELYDDAIEMLDAMKGTCQGVYIATGIASHAPLAIAAAERGYHIHLEKPPAATVQDVDAMIEACEKHGVYCLVGFQQVHRRDLRLIRQRIDDGKLGKVKRVSCYASWPREQRYYDRNEWAGMLKVRGNWVLDGPEMNALAHQVTNLLLFASGEAGRLAVPTGIRAELYTAGELDSHTTAAIEIRTAEGVEVTFNCSHAGDKLFGPYVTVEAEKGVAKWALLTGEHEIQYADGSTEQAEENDDHVEMVANLTEAIEKDDGSVLRCSLVEGRKMVAVLNGAHESSGRIHRIGQEFWHMGVGDEGTPRLIVDGMDDVLRKAGENRCLIGDLEGRPKWAVNTEMFELDGYASFPQRFEG